VSSDTARAVRSSGLTGRHRLPELHPQGLVRRTWLYCGDTDRATAALFVGHARRPCGPLQRTMKTFTFPGLGCRYPLQATILAASPHRSQSPRRRVRVPPGVRIISIASDANPKAIPAARTGSAFVVQVAQGSIAAVIVEHRQVPPVSTRGAFETISRVGWARPLEGAATPACTISIRHHPRA